MTQQITDVTGGSKRRTMLKHTVSALAALAITAGLAAQSATEPGARIPADYRSWTHVKSMVIHDKAHPLFADFGGIHHIYVNKKGVDRLKRGGSSPYPDGTVFAFDLLEAPEEGGAYVEGQRKALATMTKNAKRYAETGGWAFAVFPKGDASQAATGEATKACFACHEAQAGKTDFVFSQWRP